MFGRSESRGNMNYIGIDPGRKGAIGFISDEGTIIKVWDMPPEQNRGIDLSEWAIIFGDLYNKHVKIALEWNQGRPHDVPDFAFRFGLQTGQIDGWLKAKGYDVVHLSPQRWKPYFGLPGKQDDPHSIVGCELFDRCYPTSGHLVVGPRGGILDGRLDALLIAHYLRTIDQSPVGNKGGKRKPRFLGMTND